jgi:hypothetical protein
MSVYKTFKPTEKVDVQFRAEGFNVFNHTQFSSLDSSVVTNGAAGRDFFMRATSAHKARVLQFGLKVVF